MALVPAVIDARPSYLEGSTNPSSLLLLPAGEMKLIEFVQDMVSEITSLPMNVLTTFVADTDYERGVRSARGTIGCVIEVDGFAHLVATLEPADWLLILDLHDLPSSELELSGLISDVDDRWGAIHLVALGSEEARTRERVQVDAEQRVSRIERYYGGVTWLRTSGVSASLVRVAAAMDVGGRAFDSLAELRRQLGALGVPSTDRALRSGSMDLTRPCGMLRFMEQVVLQSCADRQGVDQAAPAHAHIVGRDVHIDPSVRLRGPVVVQDHATIEPDVVIIGPTAIGEGATIERNCVVAQSLVVPGVVVPRETTVRHRVLATPEPGAGADDAAFGSDESCQSCSRLGRGTTCSMPSIQSVAPGRGLYLSVKRCLETVFAVVGLVALSPLLAAVAALIKLTSDGPVFYGDEREGKGGRVFRCWKFRTMVKDAQAKQRELYADNAVDGPQFKLSNDPRVTWLGSWLRATNIDELPQLYNVAKGEMSLIGPRPSPFRENQICVPWRHSRLSVRPGITGLWQICRHERSSGDFHQWIYYDMLYVRHVCLWLDLKVLLATLVTLGGRFPVPVSWMISRRKRERAYEEAAMSTWSPTLDDPDGDGRETSGAEQGPAVTTPVVRPGDHLDRQTLASEVRKLRELSLRVLPRMYLRDRKAFVHHVRRKDKRDVRVGVSDRYTAIALLGLSTQAEEAAREVLGGHGPEEVCTALIERGRHTEDIGALALTLWAARRMGHPRASVALDRLRQLDPVEGPHPTVEVAWALTALTIEDDELATTDLADAVAARLMVSHVPESRLFPHWPEGTRAPLLRSHVTCFADQVYPLQALAHYHRRTGDEQALALANHCAAEICHRMGEAGQWWWHYDARNGEVLERYPVYAIHQDAMAPMALFDLKDACNVDYGREIALGLSWLLHAPEIDGSLIDSEADLIWRKVGRREPGKVVRATQAMLSKVHESFRLPAVNAIAPPRRIDDESRPYHYGWLLYAWTDERVEAFAQLQASSVPIIE